MNLIECECCGGRQFTFLKNAMVCDFCGSMYRISEDERIVSKEVTNVKVYTLIAESEKCRAHDDTAGELRALTEALDLDENNAMIWNKLGRAYRKNREYEQAKECYRKTIELSPDFPYAYTNMGVVCTFTEEYSTALEYYNKGLLMHSTKDPEYPTALANYGVLLGRMGDKKGARKAIGKAEIIGYENGKTAREVAGLPNYGRTVWKIAIRVLKMLLR